ncbi:MAG TPA: HDOD domain-containing protein [Gammaproteobacteria bacterium]|nr:HDOD domain-containing protein [Gammaproteobacteria bacterium]
MQNIFIGRQPIYDSGLKVQAYELLFRSGPDNHAVVANGDQATSQVILNAVVDIGLDQLVGNAPAFINLTRNFLVRTEPLPLPPDRVVLEVLEDIQVDGTVLAAVRRLADMGYTIALDDFVFREELRPLLELAEIVKIDIRNLGRSEVQDHVQQMQRYPLTLLAEKVETYDDLAFCKDLGFQRFQGYFFSRPKVITGQRIPANRLATLQLLAKLQQPDTEVAELEKIIQQDLTLSFRLLRYINSAFFALPRKVESIRQAVVYLGTNAIKTWVALLALSGIDDKPHELMTVAMVRAKMCELLAQAMSAPHPDAFFTVGLFSALDAILDIPMDQVVASLPLSDEITAALLRREGLLGSALDCALAYEQAHWDEVAFGTMNTGHITEVYVDALAWACQVSSALSARD